MSITKEKFSCPYIEANMEHTSFTLTVSLLMTISLCIDNCVVFYNFGLLFQNCFVFF